MRILVTRPKSQATQLVDDLHSAGYQTDCLPLLNIVPMQLSGEETAKALEIIKSSDKIIAVSANAARQSLPLLEQSNYSQPLFCIGPSTAEVFRDHGYEVKIPAGSFNSETLLKLPEFVSVKGETVAILCGQGGRDYLEEKLADLDAKLRRVELYSREPLDVEDLEIEHMEIPDALTAMSGDTAEALARALDLTGRGEWKSLPLVVPGNRVRAIAEGLGFDQIIAADKPTTEGLIDTLEKMQRKSGNSSASDPQAV
jgi:uroporphyrinogen-III synthase